MKKYLVGVQETLIDSVEVSVINADEAKKFIQELIESGAFNINGDETDGAHIFDVTEIKI
jgi:polyhydroxyalkanoate synthesis regulator phasin